MFQEASEANTNVDQDVLPNDPVFDGLIPSTSRAHQHTSPSQTNHSDHQNSAARTNLVDYLNQYDPFQNDHFESIQSREEHASDGESIDEESMGGLGRF